MADEQTIPGSAPRGRSLGQGTPARMTPRPKPPSERRCPKCGWRTFGRAGCVHCEIDRGERHGWATLEELGLKRVAREKPPFVVLEGTTTSVQLATLQAVCKDCGESKPWTEFWPAAKWPDGTMQRPQSYCKACNRRRRAGKARADLAALKQDPVAYEAWRAHRREIEAAARARRALKGARS
jgi:hypothetical protein